MLVWLALSTVASLLASLVLGVRLLRLAVRTGQAPELAMGASFLFAGVIGYALMMIGNPGGQRSTRSWGGSASRSASA